MTHTRSSIVTLPTLRTGRDTRCTTRPTPLSTSALSSTYQTTSLVSSRARHNYAIFLLSPFDFSPFFLALDSPLPFSSILPSPLFSIPLPSFSLPSLPSSFSPISLPYPPSSSTHPLSRFLPPIPPLESVLCVIQCYFTINHFSSHV